MATLAGVLLTSFSPSRVVVPGILVLFVGLILCATIENLSQFYLSCGISTGTGITCIAIISYSAILAHWFEKKPGISSGIAVSGMGLGTSFLVPFCQPVTSERSMFGLHGSGTMSATSHFWLTGGSRKWRLQTCMIPILGEIVAAISPIVTGFIPLWITNMETAPM